MVGSNHCFQTTGTYKNTITSTSRFSTSLLFTYNQSIKGISQDKSEKALSEGWLGLVHWTVETLMSVTWWVNKPTTGEDYQHHAPPTPIVDMHNTIFHEVSSNIHIKLTKYHWPRNIVITFQQWKIVMNYELYGGQRSWNNLSTWMMPGQSRRKRTRTPARCRVTFLDNIILKNIL